MKNSTFSDVSRPADYLMQRQRSGEKRVSHYKDLNRAVSGVTLGNMVEWFDFAIYSSMATIMAQVFFPQTSAYSQLIAIYAAFAAGFIIRPLGGFVFGPIGDRFGRRTALISSISLMSGATLIIALIPSYQSIGIAAPCLLVLMRMLQGLSTGGEYGGSCIFIAEHCPDKRRSFFTSWLEFGNISGFLIGGLVVSLVSHLVGETQMASWGWRIPFALAGLMGVVAIFIRLNLDETPVFRQMQKESRAREANTSQKSLWQNMLAEWPQMLRAAGLVATFNVSYYIILGYVPGYLTNVLGYSQSFSSNLSLVATLGLLLFIPLFGALGDRFGRKRMLVVGCLLMVVFALPAFHLLRHHHAGVMAAALAVLIFAMLFFEGTMPGTLTSLFRAPVRYSCFAISYNISVSLLGGTAPLINTWLIEKTGNVMIPAWYLIGGALLGLMALWGLRDRTGKPLPG
ncbi:MFS transporter [Izhakiella australiensis]|uniref:MFS transporter n=1 Tax=Izhakiella australiensis TaxID=1926881 RepID=A0A1S8YR50_9GAMM|nr:MFS transporter [Izhakiella australiensis]OON41671.1 MFS transporter [Izhakiella australiensis]